MRRIADLTGRKFHDLTVHAQAGRNEDGKILWLCKCKCGTMTVVTGHCLVADETKSCGCRKRAPDLTGNRFGRLLVLKRSPRRRGDFWVCLCTCGGKKEVSGLCLRKGSSRSCGCLQRELAGKRHRTHGMSGSPEFVTWRSMRVRCSLKTDKDYPKYGGRGIRVCERWRSSFENFYADMGARPSPCHSLHRKDVEGDYCPENCTWATADVQNNGKTNNVYVTHAGRTQTLAQWSRETGIPYNALRTRVVEQGWSSERALTTPVRLLGKKRKSSQKRRQAKREYRIWGEMLNRCRNPRSSGYAYYGARGIRVCRRWWKFDNFYADMGPVPAGLTLERINNSRGYSPSNCRWATRQEQNNNTSHNTFVTCHDETHTLAEWSRITGIPYARLMNRIVTCKWTPERALTTGGTTELAEVASMRAAGQLIGYKYARIMLDALS